MPDDHSDPQEIILVPVDENGRVLLFTDIKIERVDRDYRTIRDPNGLAWKIVPGDYTVKVFLRNLQIKEIPLHVEPGVARYRLPVTEQAGTPASPEESDSQSVSFHFEPTHPTPPRPAPEIITPLVVPSPAPQAPVAAQQSKPDQGFKDRRKVTDSGSQKRFPISFPVSYRTDSGKWVKAKALNVSGSGLCVENIGKITEEDNLYVRLHVPVATIPIECPARVVWVTSKDTRSPCMGLQLFLTANMRESLDRWLSGIEF